MKGTRIVLGVALACSLAAVTGVRAAHDNDHARLTLAGCVVAGEAKNSYMVTDALLGGADAHRAPQGAFYRLESAKGLKEHVGRRVEISGVVDLGDVDKGTLKVKTEDDGKTIASIDSERKTVKAEVSKNSDLVPSVMAGSEGSMKATVATYKFKVSSVRRLIAPCE